jgi:glutathione peroxidase
MKKSLAMIAAVSLVAALGAGVMIAAGPDAPAASAPEKPATSPYVLGYTLKDIDGKDTDLAQFKGKVVLMVNVASKCGYTPQYKGLEKLYSEKKDAGLVILGFPANEFGGQEPGDESTIKKTCHDTYHVTFPMFSKISVKGNGQHPLYKQLAAQPAPVGGDPKWNFTKFLVDRAGNVVARFDSSVTPEDKAMRAKIDELLAAKP